MAVPGADVIKVGGATCMFTCIRSRQAQFVVGSFHESRSSLMGSISVLVKFGIPSWTNAMEPIATTMSGTA
jgi:hypothetical protein